MASTIGENGSNKIEAFIMIFNSAICSGKFSLNNALDEIPHLTDSEFAIAKNLAHEQGWLLSQQPDNYNTTTYKIEKQNGK